MCVLVVKFHPSLLNFKVQFAVHILQYEVEEIGVSAIAVCKTQTLVLYAT